VVAAVGVGEVRLLVAGLYPEPRLAAARERVGILRGEDQPDELHPLVAEILEDVADQAHRSLSCASGLSTFTPAVASALATAAPPLAIVTGSPLKASSSSSGGSKAYSLRS